MGNANKNQNKKDMNDSLVGVFKSNSGSLGDDEMDGSRVESTQKIVSKCNRCKIELKTRARYCRKCYESKDDWMPVRPNRRVSRRQLARLESTQSQDSEMLFVPNRLDNLFMKGDVPVPDPNFSNLPQQSIRRQTSDSSLDFNADRKEKRIERREYIKLVRKDMDSSDASSSTSSDLNVCIKCRLRRPNAFVCHGEQIHDNTCYTCATELMLKRGGCAECGRIIDRVIKKNIYF